MIVSERRSFGRKSNLMLELIFDIGAAIGKWAVRHNGKVVRRGSKDQAMAEYKKIETDWEASENDQTAK